MIDDYRENCNFTKNFCLHLIWYPSNWTQPFFPVQEVSGAILTVKTLSRTFQNKEVHRTVNGGAKHGWTVEEQLMICRNWQVSDTRADEGVTLGGG